MTTTQNEADHMVHAEALPLDWVPAIAGLPLLYKLLFKARRANAQQANLARITN
jgi:hypothetical protein